MVGVSSRGPAGLRPRDQTVFYAMAAVPAASLVIARVWLPRGRVESVVEETPHYVTAG